MPDPRIIQCGCGASHTPDHPHFGDQERGGATVPEQWYLDATNTIRDLQAQLADRDAQIAELREATVAYEACHVAGIHGLMCPEHRMLRAALRALDARQASPQPPQDTGMAEQRSGASETQDHAEGPEKGLK